MADKKTDWKAVKEQLTKEDKEFVEVVEKAVKPDAFTEEQWTNFCANLGSCRRKLMELHNVVSCFLKSQDLSGLFSTSIPFGPIEFVRQIDNALSQYESFIKFTSLEHSELVPMVTDFYKYYCRLLSKRADLLTYLINYNYVETEDEAE